MKTIERVPIWSPGMNIELPVRGEDIKYFKEWVNWNCYSNEHDGFDFAAYINSKGKCVLGLPAETPIRAIADGAVMQVSQGLTEGDGYGTWITIEHGKESYRVSQYHHVNPLVDWDQHVKKGDVIATLHKDNGSSEGRLVHLHLCLYDWPENIKRRGIDPEQIFPEVARLKAYPQGRKNFSIPNGKKIKVVHANFRNLRSD